MRRLALGAVILALVAVARGGAFGATGHTLKPGETLAAVAQKYYGNNHYELVIAKLNKVKDPGKPPAGTVLRVPELKEMLLTEGFPSALAPEAEQMAKARYTVIKLHEQLDRALRPGNGEGMIRVPAAVRGELRGAADALDKAGKVLARQGNYSDSATRIRQRLNGAAELLRQLGAGSAPAGAEDRIHLLLAQAFVRALMWARNEDGDVKEWAPP